MKRYFFTIALMGLMVVFWDPSAKLIGKLLLLEEPTTKQITHGDWLSKVAQKHYGDASYWRELALVNRAPDANLIFPEEKVIVPSFSAIQKIRNAKSLTTVNQLVDEQRNILASKGYDTYEEAPPYVEHSEPAGSDDMTSKQQDFATPESSQEYGEPLASKDDEGFTITEEPILDEENDSFWASTPMITAYIILAVLIAIGAVMYYRNKKREEVEYYGDSDQEEKKESNPFFFGNGDDDRPTSKKKKEREEELVS